MNVFLDNFHGRWLQRSVRWLSLHRSWIHAWMALGTVLTVSMVWEGGGIVSPSLLWLAIWPNAALFFRSQTTTVAWLSVVWLVLIGIGLSAPDPVLNMHEMMMGQSGMSMVMHLVLVQLCLMVIHLAYDKRYRQKRGRIAASITNMKAMQNKLQLTESYKDRFIATVSEDLRSPMNTILGYSNVLTVMATQRPELNDTVQHIRTSIQQLLDMTNNILDHAQLNAGQLQLNLQPMSLPQLIQKEWAQWSMGTKVEFKILVPQKIPDWLWCDENRFKQIVNILLGNAKKFTSQGQVLLQFSYQSGMLSIDIFDTGVGITDDVKAFIFQRFDQGHADKQHQFGGIGLGLTNAMALTHLFGGSIGFDSQNCQGSRFWVRLPLRLCNGKLDRKDGAACTQALVHGRILILDEEPLGQMVMAQAIRQVWPQAQITQTSHGEQAIKHLHVTDFDAVLMNGWMTYAEAGAWGLKIRQDLATRSRTTALMGVTSSKHSAAKAQLILAGMDDVMVKPVDAQQLNTAICKWITTRQALENSVVT